MPTRFFRDWIVSRYLDKILEQVKGFKRSLNRIEFKIIEENRNNPDITKIDELRDYIKNLDNKNKDKALKYVENLIKLCDLYYNN